MRKSKTWRRSWIGVILTLVMAGVASSGVGQSSVQQARFAPPCSECWPGWTEVARPAGGIGPSVRNAAAFIFINGHHDDPTLNQEHLQFSSLSKPPSEVTVAFQFNNATVGGRLWFSTGNFLCLPPEYVSAYVTDELLIVTLRDTGDSWLGAFLGDVTLLDPDFVPGLGGSRAHRYTTIGLLAKTGDQWQVLAVKAISQVTRFSPVQARVRLDESDVTAPSFIAEFNFANGRTETTESESDPVVLGATGMGGIIYLVGKGSPCTTLTQREVMIHSFSER